MAWRQQKQKQILKIPFLNFRSLILGIDNDIISFLQLKYFERQPIFYESEGYEKVNYAVKMTFWTRDLVKT